MKKILLCTFVALLLSLNSYSQRNGVTVQGGYSWLNGVVGAEVQLLNFGFSFGYMPTKMPLSGSYVSSFSGALTWYGKEYDESCMYGSFGMASAGYRYEDSNGYEKTEPMTIAMLGYRYVGDTGFSSKLGLGYGWNELANTVTFEITLGYTLPF